MPIRPENKSRYPKDWKQVRERILARAENKCERCRVPNRASVARGAGRHAGTYMLYDGRTFNDETGEALGMSRGSEYDAGRGVEIVLTIAHLDHTPENSEPTNLQALCQQCHLRHDSKHHAETRKRAAAERKGQKEMFT
jgi:hypothetical protein